MWMKMPPTPVRGPVVICHRPINITWIPGAVSEMLPQHHWVKTPTQEGGMGADCPIPGQQCSDMPYSSTSVVNHMGQSGQAGATCDAMGDDIDVDCVNRLLRVGRPTGAWTVTNQCMTFSYDTVAQCRRRR
jgi:hypothetical protein